MTEYVAHSGFKPGLIVHVFAVVVPKALLIEVAKQMEWLNAYIRPVDTTLQQRPEVLKPVGVDTAVDVFNGMVNNLMRIVPSQSFIGKKSISVESSTSLNMLLYFRLKSGLLAVWDNCGVNLTAALKDAHDSSLILGASTSDATGLDAQVHVTGLAADESLISFNLTRELDGRVVVQGHTDAVKHEPSRLLGDTKSTGHFAGANPILAVAENPISAHPLIEPKGGILEDRSNLETELFLASRAKPDLAGRDERVLLRPAARARNYTVREAQIERILESTVGVREVDDCLLECVRGFHSSNISLIALCVKYVIA